MILQKVIEDINQVFPHLGETQIVHALDIAHKDFIAETNYLEDYVLLSDPSTNCAWELPSDYNGFKEVLLYDTDGNPLYIESYPIAYEIGYGNIYFRSTNDTPISVMPSEITFLYLGYYKKPSDLTSPASVFEVGDDHLGGVYSKVYKECYAKYPIDNITRTGEIVKALNFNAANFWAGQEISYRIKAKRWVNSKNDSSDGFALYQEAGRWLLPKRIKSLIGTTTAIGTSMANTKEANFIITPSGTTQVGDIIGFAAMVATLDLPNNRVTFTGDISNYTDFESNNKGWDKISEVTGVSITVEWSDGITGIIVATIFEKVAH